MTTHATPEAEVAHARAAATGLVGLTDADGGPVEVLAMAEDAVARRRDAEVAELRACLAWSDLHGDDPRDEPAYRSAPGAERLVRLGGDGTPEVRDLSLLELGIALQRHPLAVRAMTADALDLRHRLPRTWRRLLDGDAEVWVARKVASMSRAVPQAAIGKVDDAVSRAITGVAPSRLLAIAEAAVIAADAWGHRTRHADARARRHVSLARPESTGLRTLVARLTCGDALHVDAVVDRVADILTAQRRTDGAAALPHDHVRAEAMGWLARPAELLALLVEHTQPDQPDEHTEPREQPSPAIALRADVLAALTAEVLERLRPTATLYVHLHESAVGPGRGTDCAGVARVEAPGHRGPLDVLWIRDLLGPRTTVVVKPVIDTREHHAVDAYEHPAWMRERIHLRSPAEAFPHAARLGRSGTDLDHPVPWDPGDPPGQTTTDSQPLSRLTHRGKTVAGYTVTPTPAGTVWRSRHGLHRLVDTHGRTHRLTADEAETLTHGRSGLDTALDRILQQQSA